MKLLGSFLLLCSALWAQHFSAGVVGGVPFTDGLSDTTVNEVDLIQRTYSDSKLYIVGPMVEVRLPLGLSVEADGLYRPINSSLNLQLVPGPLYHSYSENVATWEFPVLGKYRLPLLPILKPFVEAGPSFRTTGSSLSYLSGAGITAGVGVEFKLLKLRIDPQVRYTHWGADAVPPPGVEFYPPSQQNQAEFLVGFSF